MTIPYWLNWKTILTFIAIVLVSGTIIYSNYVSGKIAAEERISVENWVEAQKTILTASDTSNIHLAAKLIVQNTKIPIIETNEKEELSGNYFNLDSLPSKEQKPYLTKKLAEFKRYNKQPIVLVLAENPYTANHYYYGESKLLKEVRWYPFIQLMIVLLFIAFIVMIREISNRSEQNQLWASMAKETAHQLGTPVSSLQGWLEILKEDTANQQIVPEIAKDINRLLLITDRFGKIGSVPNLELHKPAKEIHQMIDYMKKRTSAQVQISANVQQIESLELLLSPPLFDWVLENLIKNAMDAIEGKGSIHIEASRDENELFIDVTDTGKGIAKGNTGKVFKPGFTTKKRGWGLGLTLSKRIIDQYHNGRLFVKWTEPQKGTTFRITLPLQK